MQVQCVKNSDKNFPSKLRNVKPQVGKIWYRGRWPASAEATAGKDKNIFYKCAAVVGTRRMSRYGRQVVEEVVPRLVTAGYTIVSGLMYGVDQLAHKETLRAGGKAIAVLGYGITNKNEEEAWKLEQEIEKSGGLVLSEYEGESVSQMWMFPQRNRIVVGLSDIVVIVEGGIKSGSLLTARMARKAGKAVYAVPGSIFSTTSEGTNELIARGEATPLTLSELAKLTGTSNDQGGSQSVIALVAGEREIYESLKIVGPQSTNELGRHLTTPMKEILTLLSQMELKGLAVNERGVWRITG